ncbi:MAG: hypothetical protein ACREBP_08160 [Sphingomicrobium sp.]
MNCLPFALTLVLALAACDEDRPPEPTSAQADQLNEAEAMLNQMEQKERAAPSGTALPVNRD